MNPYEGIFDSCRISLTKALIKTGAVLYGDFTLSSGMKSDIFVNASRALLTSEGMFCVTEFIFYTGDNLGLKPDSIGGPSSGADLIIGGFLARQDFKNPTGFLVRKELNFSGRRKLDGTVGLKPILVDDVTTTGASLLTCADVLSEFGVKPLFAVSVVDREQGAVERLAEKGISLYPILTLSELRKAMP